MSATYNAEILLAGARGILIDGALAGPGEELFSDVFRFVDGRYRTENIAYAGPPPMVQPLAEDIQFFPLTHGKVTVNAQDFLAGAEVYRRDLEDSQIPEFLERIQTMANYARVLPNQQLISSLALNSYGGPVAYDGSNYFASHSDRGAGLAQSNTQSGSGTSISNIAADLTLAIGIISAFLDENAQPLNTSLSRMAILAPSSMYFQFKQIMESGNYPIVFGSNTAAVAQDNVFNTVAPIKLYLSPRLSANHDWYLFNTTGNPSKPFAWIEKEGLQIEVLGPGTETWVRGQKMAFTARMRGVLAPLNPFTGVQTTNS